MKHGIWKTATPGMDAVNALVRDGYAPLAAMVLASRGLEEPSQAHRYLNSSTPLYDPFLLTDMGLAAGRVGLAMSRGEKIAVFGDYDVDGITATCLLTEFLRQNGCDCVPYIPGRLEEGYGLNPIAIEYLHGLGVTLIITVDCGITAVEEAALCKQLGIDLVITDHHECKEQLPDAVAVVNPHRPDGGYPHKTLSGVGVAFKLAAALSGSQEEVLEQFADVVCLGTVADVMPLQGENRTFVTRGLEILRKTQRPGLAALMQLSGCDCRNLTATTLGYILSPRINAAGRMGQIDLAVELFLTRDTQQGETLAKALCDLNRRRQEVESEIYAQAVDMLPPGKLPEAIVLADESWHQGVVGIVASRIAEEYCCPTFLICLDGDHGKASSRSFGGFNLFSSLTTLSHLLESYGGHELAAGFTIRRQQIGAFRESISRLAAEFYRSTGPKTVLEADCVVPPEMLTLRGIESLNVLEPCGNGCPKPVLVMENLQVERIGQVGGGKHMRLRLTSPRGAFNAIYFSSNAQAASIQVGDLVDVAFVPQINDFRGERTVQMNIQDIRPACKTPVDCDTGDYLLLRNRQLDASTAARLLPDRMLLGQVWRYLSGMGTSIEETPICLCRKIVRWSDMPMDLSQLLTCLDIFQDVGLLEIRMHHKYISIRLLPTQQKADLNASQTMQQLLAAKES
ncbi:MAG: single-stranded-DNA-specific exonuclease RecJ [Oscillospiraceae bacterium]|nr:single-stranded-DNA-specific exonuclease RecJ [Oscillospiraceae bacterium]